jgi:hypothetical protein
MVASGHSYTDPVIVFFLPSVDRCATGQKFCQHRPPLPSPHRSGEGEANAANCQRRHASSCSRSQHAEPIPRMRRPRIVSRWGSASAHAAADGTVAAVLGPRRDIFVGRFWHTVRSRGLCLESRVVYLLPFSVLYAVHVVNHVNQLLLSELPPSACRATLQLTLAWQEKRNGKGREIDSCSWDSLTARRCPRRTRPRPPPRRPRPCTYVAASERIGTLHRALPCRTLRSLKCLVHFQIHRSRDVARHWRLHVLPFIALGL